MTARPEYATVSIAHDLDQAQHRLACIAEHMSLKDARELILTARRLRRIRSLFVKGEISNGIAQAFIEAGNLIAGLAERGQR